MTTSSAARRRRAGACIATLGGLVLSSALLLGAPTSAHATTAGWCIGPAPTTPCIVAAARDGVPVTSADPTYGIQLVEVPTPTPWSVNWSLYGKSAALPVDEVLHTWAITLDLGGHVPRFSFAHSTPGTVARTMSGTHHLVTMTGNPVTLTQGCDGYGVCPSMATTQWASYLDGWVYDADWYAAQGVTPSAWNGSNMWTNIDWTEFPPTIAPGGGLQITVANSHFRTDGTTVVHGFLVQDLPYSLVNQVLHVDNPAALVGSGVLATLSGTGSGSIAVTMNDATALVHVAASNITFSRRTLTIRRGIVVPLPGVVQKAVRQRIRTRVAVTVAPGVSRGSALTGYQAQCYRIVGRSVVALRLATLPGGHGRVVVVANVATSGTWLCHARVLSRVGPGPWGRPYLLR